MSLANLFNSPVSPEDFNIFSFSNMDQHVQIVNGIFTTKGLSLPVYALDPLPPDSVLSWLEIHQAMHDNFTQALGIAGVDLTDVDFKDPEQLSAWSRLHACEHQLASDMLGLT